MFFSLPAHECTCADMKINMEKKRKEKKRKIEYLAVYHVDTGLRWNWMSEFDNDNIKEKNF
jgi:hypothetical protein